MPNKPGHSTHSSHHSHQTSGVYASQEIPYVSNSSLPDKTPLQSSGLLSKPETRLTIKYGNVASKGFYLKPDKSQISQSGSVARISHHQSDIHPKPENGRIFQHGQAARISTHQGDINSKQVKQHISHTGQAARLSTHQGDINFKQVKQNISHTKQAARISTHQSGVYLTADNGHTSQTRPAARISHHQSGLRPTQDRGWISHSSEATEVSPRLSGKYSTHSKLLIPHSGQETYIWRHTNRRYPASDKQHTSHSRHQHTGVEYLKPDKPNVINTGPVIHMAISQSSSGRYPAIDNVHSKQETDILHMTSDVYKTTDNYDTFYNSIANDIVRHKSDHYVEPEDQTISNMGPVVHMYISSRKGVTDKGQTNHSRHSKNAYR